MVLLGIIFIFLAIWAFIKRKSPEESPLLLRLLLINLPLPYLACQLGWIVAEVGRQPWIVYGILKVTDAVSPISSLQATVSLIAFTVVYTILGIICFWLVAYYARKGPEKTV